MLCPPRKTGPLRADEFWGAYCLLGVMDLRKGKEER